MGTGNKTVIVTGVSSGIGFAIADAYLDCGYNVVGNARTPERLRVPARLGNPRRFVLFAGDISKPGTSRALFEKAFERFGKVDILINNASVLVAKAAVDYSGEDLENMVDASLRGFFYPTQQAAKHMSANRQGHIVSITASIPVQPEAQAPAFLPSLIKGGINQATRALAFELAAHNVKVSAVAPGIIGTPLQAAGTVERPRASAPVGAPGTVRQIVDAVLYLTSSELTTGMVIPVGDATTAGAAHRL